MPLFLVRVMLLACRSSALSVYTHFLIHPWRSYFCGYVDVMPMAKIDVSDLEITLSLSVDNPKYFE